MGIVTERQVVPELMDAPDLAAWEHDAALRGLRRLNGLSKAARLIAREVGEMARGRKMGAVTILDVACGGGDVPVGVAGELRKMGIGAALTLTDRSATALALARQGAEAAGMGGQVGAEVGIAPDQLPEGSWDFVTNSLFLHHLARGEVVGTLAEMARRARVGVVISDLRRSGVGLAVAWATCRVVTRSRIVHHDGPVSVRAAWTMGELGAMAREAGLGGARVRACWPWRMMLTWERA